MYGFLKGLSVDKAITLQQAWRWHGFRRCDIALFVKLERRRLRKFQSQRGKHSTITFASLGKRQPFEQTDQYRHVAGTAEIRRVLQAYLVDWQSMAWQHGARHTPDALWRKPEAGLAAIECDTGSYSGRTILSKAEAFAEFSGGQIWGCVTEKRADNVRALVQQVDPDAIVVVASPYEDEPENLER